VWLHRHARTATAIRSARTFVTVSGDRVAGYYALAAGSVERSAAAGRLGRGMSARPVPVVVLARLAVDERDQGVGVGRGLTRVAMLRALTAAERSGYARRSFTGATSPPGRSTPATASSRPRPMRCTACC
jgi:predicted N-acetyltransferase YhbS